MNTDISRLRDFVVSTTKIVSEKHEEKEILDALNPLLADLVGHDDWLPPEFSKANDVYYQQYLLHCDPLQRFSVVCLVWGPRQFTPVHDHTVWGLVGVLRGAETSVSYERDSQGKLIAGETEILRAGDVCAVSPDIGDIHRVSNADPNSPSISIHVYGANIGAITRHVFDEETGAVKDFISGYSSSVVPNLWDRSAASGAASSR